MKRSMVVVETGLDERAGGRLIEGRVIPRIRHARTRFIEHVLEPVSSSEVARGEGWTALLVKARLRRFADVSRRLPFTPDAPPLRADQASEVSIPSCMPAPLREYWKDQPDGKVRRLPVTIDELAMHRAMLNAIAPLIEVASNAKWQLLWGLAGRQKGPDVGKAIGCSARTALNRMVALAEKLAGDWNRLTLPLDEADYSEAEAIIHRNF